MIRSMPEFVRQCLWELEQGESGTPHVQGYLRLKTQQRLSFLRSHYLSRAHYTGLTTEEWKQNTKKYVQKQDETAVGCVVQENQSVRTFFPAEIPELIVKEMTSLVDGYVPVVIEHEIVHFDHHELPRVRFREIYDRAIRNLITQYRIEMLVMRPEVLKVVRSYYLEINERINTQQTNVEEDENRSQGTQEVNILCTSS